jgi:hypothetical protein
VFNTASTALSEELLNSVAPFGTAVETHGHNSFPAAASRAIKFVSFDEARLLRHRPSVAGDALQAVLTLLPEEFPIRKSLSPILRQHWIS